MESSIIDHSEWWPELSFNDWWRKPERRKKVVFFDYARNYEMLCAIRASIVSGIQQSSADFSNIYTFISSIPSQIKPIRETRKNAEQFSRISLWRNTSPELKAYFYQFAMQREQASSNGNLIHTSFTLNLTPTFVKRAMKSKEGIREYIKRKLDKSFENSLGRQPQYWFVVELVDARDSHPYENENDKKHLTMRSGRKRPHLHGSILLKPSEFMSVRKQKRPVSEAFHKAVGKCKKGFGNRLVYTKSHKSYAKQNNISELQAALGWARYCLKYHSQSNILLNLKNNLTADNVSKGQAEVVYGIFS